MFAYQFRLSPRAEAAHFFLPRRFLSATGKYCIRVSGLVLQTLT
jgi:hypothetical protein